MKPSGGAAELRPRPRWWTRAGRPRRRWRRAGCAPMLPISRRRELIGAKNVVVHAPSGRVHARERGQLRAHGGPADRRLSEERLHRQFLSTIPTARMGRCVVAAHHRAASERAQRHRRHHPTPVLRGAATSKTWSTSPAARCAYTVVERERPPQRSADRVRWRSLETSYRVRLHDALGKYREFPKEASLCPE